MNSDAVYQVNYVIIFIAGSRRGHT